MDLTRFVQKELFQILSAALIVCTADQLYMMQEYGNISEETFCLTLLCTGISLYFGFFTKKKD